MFYVSSKNGEKYGITDTSDGVEDFYTKEDLFKIVTNLKIDVDGIDLELNNICIVNKNALTLKYFKEGNFHLALSRMSLSNTTFGLRFKTKGGTFISHYVLNIARSGINKFSMSDGRSKSYRSGLTFDDVLSQLNFYYTSYILEGYNIGGF